MAETTEAVDLVNPFTEKLHPLKALRSIPVITDFEEAYKAWWENGDADMRLRFIYRGFELSGTLDRKIEVFLTIANGYRIRGFFGREEFHPENISIQYFLPARLKTHVATKAWEVVCEHFFKDRGRNKDHAYHPDHDPGPKSWEGLITPTILHLVFCFFEEPQNYPRDSESGGNHYDESARDFLWRIVRYGWEGRNWTNGECIRDEIVALIRSDRKRLIRMAYRLDRADYLLKKWMYLSDEESAYLEEIARKPSIIYPWIKQESVSIEEALYDSTCGSPGYTFAATALQVRELRAQLIAHS